ncbi:gas vesicle protein [Pseudonocardia sp. C8]|nr:gas vesicle protein [Pseudonocardia sp. C8]
MEDAADEDTTHETTEDTTDETSAEASDHEEAEDADQEDADQEDTDRDGTEPARPRRLGARAVARAAVEQIAEMTGRTPEGVTSVARSEDGWSVEVEMVEVRRIPDSADVLAVYQADLDADAELIGYRRMRRYNRGAGGDA